ncbi:MULTISPECIES: DNA repair protein [unclassified Ruegeria]|uniref:DNA repair protein n=1 Tax=unclassified Ruegeria TaxID=2625375 RepID=UPI001488AE1C|nr:MULTISPECIES: DNA repair protein [unclassified Ruegeria]NOD78005.1 DNA repair protein [Ruegeria sp. HKCCD4332]NOD87589.1 DNA repair protein [Ruegeria sp. HKCCD4318]NOE15622.1 DNA repair protein [Ruegeria sp. HKCCD4318-2]NOG08687.1 DNA repair protein [Ruegeria sp. HKCCD4315]
MAALHNITLQCQNAFLRLTFLLICMAALLAVSTTILSALGVLPWLSMQAGFGDEPAADAGMFIQIGLTALILMLAFYLPANARMMALENNHRKFALNMYDIANAYQMAHAADRSGLFMMSSEFDAVKERMAFLRQHPDLQSLEPEILELAAQMSQISQELAETYGDARVERAQMFLQQRQQEIELFQQRLEEAQVIQNELRQWTRDVEMEETIAKSQLARLRDELFELLPELSTQLQTPRKDSASKASSVVAMSPPRAAE